MISVGFTLGKMVRKKVVLQIVCEIILHIACFIFFVTFFFYDQIDAYVKERYTLANGFVKAEALEFPTTTIF